MTTYWKARGTSGGSACAAQRMISGVLHGGIIGFLALATAVAQQIAIPRIEQMPNAPSPYLMRDWKGVARGYDSLAFDVTRTGTYLPLLTITTSTVNYPAHPSFGLSTVVGTTAPGSWEAINCLPAVVGATLAGIDKSSGVHNWALMAEEWFNRRPAQNVYKNHPVDDSGDDWWYSTMPNVFFYQLNHLYPGTGDYTYQFRTVADRWLQAVRVMGGSTIPWQVPNMDHRGWLLDTMTPYNSGVHEPEAAGALAWLLYNAYVVTDSAAYRIGAEWSMEFLHGYPTNPSYELQLAYGTYTAARMNAELGTTYDVEKMVNWCFDVGPLRSWGAIIGTWGGYDCSGLIGEVNGSNDYAFTMNTFEQIGALVPMVRYDGRFARAIGKWVLNAANASRLFYSRYLPSVQQDNFAWASQYDPSSVIAYEALRQHPGANSPYATGDAVTGGWGLTNLMLYSSSHVGILGGIIDTTNVPMILKLNVLATDYYHAPAYPSSLYFNPVLTAQSVQIDVGAGQHDLYDAVSKTFVQSGVSGTVSITIPADAARLVVITPAGGVITYDLDRMMINGIVVDYRSGKAIGNYPPRIKSLTPVSPTVVRGGGTAVYCTAVDRNGDTLSYSWQGGGGTITGNGPAMVWTAPMTEGVYAVACIADDGHGGRDTARTSVNVVARLNAPPVVVALTARPRKINLGGTSQIHCSAFDPNGDTLTYTWSASTGTVSGPDSEAVWTAPSTAGNDMIRCMVSDGYGGVVADSIAVEVRDLSQTQSGLLVAHYPFSGNANDASGHGYNGTVHGATAVPDRFGVPNSAYAFDGATNDISIVNDAGLNFQQAITVNFVMKIGALYGREQYAISHGNWQNRWKISLSKGSNVTYDRIRWTVKTATGVKDLDTESSLRTDSTYMVTALYSGADLEVYLNGSLDAFTTFSGSILPTTIDLMIGQALPADQGYNFNGILDEIRIYDYALSLQQIADLYTVTTGVAAGEGGAVPQHYILEQNYPNPFNPSTSIRIGVPAGGGRVVLRVYDLLGRQVAELVNGPLGPGVHTVIWSPVGVATGVYFCVLRSGQSTFARTMLLMR